MSGAAWRATGRAADLVAFGAGGAGVKRILVGVDGSRESRLAVEYAVDLALATGARMMLACVVFAPDPLGDPELVARTSVWEEEEHKRGEDLVRQVAAEVAGSCQRDGSGRRARGSDAGRVG